MSESVAGAFPVEACPLCSAPIVWALDHLATYVPVDAHPGDGGSVVLRQGPDGIPRAHKPSPKFAFGLSMHPVHYQTCRKPKLLRERGRGV